MTTLFPWTSEHYDYLVEITYGRSYAEITTMFNERFETDLPVRKIVAAIKRKNLKTGRTGQFEKGHPTWNKGMKGLQLGGEAGWFKKGQAPINYRPVGSERLDKDGYVMIKVQDHGLYQHRWQLKHKYLWEQANGKVPKNHCVVFLDGDRMNFDLSNLKLIKRSELLYLNRNNLLSDNSEVSQSAIALASLMVKVNEKKRGDK